MLNLFLIGTTLLFVGYLLSYACPLNKRLWSPSFVLLTCGIAALSLALLLYIIDAVSYTHLPRIRRGRILYPNLPIIQGCLGFTEKRLIILPVITVLGC